MGQTKPALIMSSGKAISAVMLATLHDQKLFEYNDPISNHWPEFA